MSRNKIIENSKYYINKKADIESTIQKAIDNEIDIAAINTNITQLEDRTSNILKTSNGSLQINTQFGQTEIGARNSSWTHFYTDRGKFYFDKEIHANHGFYVYSHEGTKMDASGVYDDGNRVYSDANIPSVLKIGDRRNDGDITPDDHPSKAVTFTFTDELSASPNVWDSVITMKGWTDSYRAWQLFSNSNETGDSEKLYFRSGIGGVWGPARTLWHSGNKPTPQTIGALPDNGTWTGGTGSPYTTHHAGVKYSGDGKFTFESVGGKVDVATDGEFYADEGQYRVYHEGNKPTTTDIDAVNSLDTNLGKNGSVPLVSLTTLDDWNNKPLGWRAMVKTSSSCNMPGNEAYYYISKFAARDCYDGSSWIAVGYDSNSFHFGRKRESGHDMIWERAVNASGDSMTGDLILDNHKLVLEDSVGSEAYLQSNAGRLYIGSDDLVEFVETDNGHSSGAEISTNNGTMKAKGFYQYDNTNTRIDSSGIYDDGNRVFSDLYISESLTPNSAKRLTSGDNLNDITTPGFYYQESNAATVNNNYPSGRAGSLLVQDSAGVATQMYIDYDGYGRLYVRSKYTGGWSNWTKMATQTDLDDTKQDVTDLDTRVTNNESNISSNDSDISNLQTKVDAKRNKKDYYNKDNNQRIDGSQLSVIMNHSGHINGPATYSTTLHVQRTTNGDGGFQIGAPYSGSNNNFYFRKQHDTSGTWSTWRRVALQNESPEFDRVTADNIDINIGTIDTLNSTDIMVDNLDSTSLTVTDTESNGDMNINGNFTSGGSGSFMVFNPAYFSGLTAGYVYRSGAGKGHLVGAHDEYTDTSTTTNPIFSIGKDHNPTEMTLGDMYGIGYTHSNAPFITYDDMSSDHHGWGMYVAANGQSKIFLNGSNGMIYNEGIEAYGISYLKDLATRDLVVQNSTRLVDLTVAGDIIFRATPSHMWEILRDSSLTSSGCSGATAGSISLSPTNGGLSTGDVIMMEVSYTNSSAVRSRMVTFTLGSEDSTPTSSYNNVGYSFRYDYEWSRIFSFKVAHYGNTLYFDDCYYVQFDHDDTTAPDVIDEYTSTLYVGRIWRMKS